MSLRDVVVGLYRTERRTHLLSQAGGIAFWLLLAVFPAGIAVVNIVGLFTDQIYPARLVGHLARATPGSLGNLLDEQLRIVAQPSPGTGLLDFLIVLLAIWSVSSAVVQIIRGIEAGYGVSRKNTAILRALAMAAALALVVILAVISWVLDSSSLVGTVVGYLLLIALIIVVLAVMYSLATGWRFPFRTALPGAALAGGLLLCFAFSMSLYFNYSTNLRVIYGAIAGIVVSMLTAWLTACAILAGSALNGVLLGARQPASPESPVPSQAS